MGRGKRNGRTTVLPLSDGERSSHSGAPVTGVELRPVPTYQLDKLNELRRELEERIEREMDGLGKGPLSDYMGLEHPDGPLRWFIDYIVYDECSDNGLNMSITLSDADIDSLDGIASIFPDYKRAQESPTPGMNIYIDWGNYDGAEGALQVAEEFYSIFDRLKATQGVASAPPSAPPDPGLGGLASMGEASKTQTP